MKNTSDIKSAIPSPESIKAELERENNAEKYKRAVRGTIAVLIVVAAVAVLCSTFFVSVLKTEGTSMDPTLDSDQYILALNTKKFGSGDLIAFYYNNKILLKRVIGSPGDWIDIDADGSVSVNGETLDEPYISDKSLGSGDVEFPYQVPDNCWFVLGDHRATSLDSRYSVIGNVTLDQVLGKVIFRLYPFDQFGILN